MKINIKENYGGNVTRDSSREYPQRMEENTNLTTENTEYPQSS
jgi:hypothetical protein